MFLVGKFRFDSAHNLVKYKGKCEKLHGHTYEVVIVLHGTPNEEDMVMDFIELKDIVKKEILDYLDHSYLNDIIEQPTSENIAIWIWNKLEKKLERENCRLYEVQVWESPDSGVIYRGEKFEGCSE